MGYLIYQQNTDGFFPLTPTWGYDSDVVISKRRSRKVWTLPTEGFVPIPDLPSVLPDYIQSAIIIPAPIQRLNRGQVFVTDYTEEILFLPGSGRMDGQYLTQFPTPYTGQIAKPGQYIGLYNPSSNVVAVNSAIVYFIPIVITYPMVIDKLGVYVTTAVSAKFCHLGVYRVELGEVGDLIATTGTILLGTTGERSGDISVRLSEGIYLFAFGSLATGVSVRACDVQTSVLPEVDGSNTSINTFYSEVVSGDFSGLNTTPTTLTLAGGSVPRIFARRQL